MLQFPPLMGTTQVTAAVCNPASPKRRWTGLFLVDTGAVDCVVPANRLKAIGIKPTGKRTYELADGTEVALEIGVGRLEFMGEIVGATVIFGKDGVEPILGVTVLESIGIEVDPRNQRLKRLPAVRLKKLLAPASSSAPAALRSRTASWDPRSTRTEARDPEP
jgi:clan AA aspartic protease